MAITEGSRRVRPASKLPEISQPWARQINATIDSLDRRLRALESVQQANSKNIEAILGAVQEINQRLSAIEETP